MLTSDSVVATAPAVGVIAPFDASAVGVGVGAGAGAGDLQPIGRSDAKPAPSERAPKPRRDRRSERRRYATMSSKESLSHMGASRRALRRRNKSEAAAPGATCGSPSWASPASRPTAAPARARRRGSARSHRPGRRVPRPASAVPRRCRSARRTSGSHRLAPTTPARPETRGIDSPRLHLWSDALRASSPVLGHRLACAARGVKEETNRHFAKRCLSRLIVFDLRIGVGSAPEGRIPAPAHAVLRAGP